MDFWATYVAKFVLNEVPRLAHKYGVSEAEVMQRVPPDRLVRLLAMTLYNI